MKFTKNLIILFLFLVTTVKSQVSVFGKVDHIVPDEVDTLGNITLTVSGSTAPYTYTWNPGAINAKDISNIGTGTYTVNVLSASTQTANYTFDLGYKVLWTNFNRCFFRNDSLVSTAANSNIYGSAASKNTLAANTDGWFEYVVDDVTSTKPYFFGFVDSLNSFSTNGDIDYGIYYTSTKQLFYYESGVGNGVIKSAPKVGDVVKIERIGDIINYRINNVIVRTTTVSGISQKNFKLKASLNNLSNRILNVGCSFKGLTNFSFVGFVDVIPVIKHCTDFGVSNGSIKVIPEIPLGNTYLWQPGGLTTQTTSSLTIGISTVTVTDSLSNSSKHKFNVGYKVIWTNLDRCYFSNDSLVNPTNNAAVYGTAMSKNTLETNTDGWFEYVIDNLGANNYYVGFSDNASSLQYALGDIDYGILYTGGSAKYISYYESGTTAVIYYSPAVGDVIRIERLGNTINYKINGVLFRTQTVTGLAQKSFKLKAQLLSINKLVNVGCSFYNKSNSTFNNYVLVIPTIKHNSGFGTSDGSVKLTPRIPFTNSYVWQPGGSVSSMISSLSLGNYSVTVKDSLLNQSPYNYNIGYKVQWTNTQSCFLRNDSLVSTTNNALIIANAISKNTLDANTDGWFEYVFDGVHANTYYVGFLDDAGAVAYSPGYIDYGFQVNSTSYLYAYENGVVTGIDYHLRIGDVLRIERVGNNINYKVNNYQVRTLSVVNISQKVFKVKANLYSVNRLVNVGCSFLKLDNTEFANYVQVKPDITHNSSMGITDGKIKVSPRIPFANTYVWQPGGSTAGETSVITPGSYTVAITDSLINKSTYSYNVGYKLNWTSLYNTILSGDTIKGTVTTNGSGVSKDTLLPNTDGWIEYVYSEPSKSFYFGFLDVPSTTQSATSDIDYGFYLNTTQYCYASENGVVNGVTYNCKLGDVFRIERVGDAMKYYLNNLLFRTTVTTGISAKALIVKAVLVNKAKLIKLGASFTSCKFTTSVSSPQVITCANPTSVLSGTSTVSGVSYSWSPGGSTPTSYSTTVSAAGTYTLKVSDGSGCVSAATVAVIANTIVPSLSIESSSGSIPTLGLTAYWPFNGNAQDYSGNANHGTVSGANLATDRFNNPNKTFSFNGVDSRIDVPNSSTVDMPDNQDFSIAFWMKSKAGNIDATPISKNEYGAWSGYMFFANNTNGGYCNAPGQSSFYVAAPGNGDACVNNPICIDTTNWYFIIGQYKASINQTSIYVNSVLQTDLGEKAGPISNTKKLSFGAYNDDPTLGFFNGYLDDIRFYNRMLTQSEMNALYNESNPANNIQVISASNPIVVLKGITDSPNVTYSWTPGGTTPTSNTTSVSSGGIYTLTVTDFINGCVSSATVLVVQLLVSADITDYESDSLKGIVNLNITGGTPPYNVAWNGLKLPTPFVAYHNLIDSLPGMTIDSVEYKNFIDSLRQRTVFNDLEPGMYPVTVYDQANDSVVMMINVGAKISSWGYKLGVTTNACTIANKVINNINYNYGTGECITQQGPYLAGNHFAIPLNIIDLNNDNELSFVVPNNNDISYVGLQETKSEINGATADINDRTMFKFNGNGTFDVMFQSQSIHSASFSSGDNFSLKTNSVSGKISYYKNEVLLIQRDYAPINTASSYISKVVLGSLGASVTGLKIIGPKKKRIITGLVTDVTCDNTCIGSIQASGFIFLGVPKYYEIYTLGGVTPFSTIIAPVSNTVVFQNLCPGIYTIKYYADVTDFFVFGGTLNEYVAITSQTFEVAYTAEWKNIVNCQVIPPYNSLGKIAPGTEWFPDGGGSTENILQNLVTNTEWIEFETNGNKNDFHFGLSTSDQNLSPLTINYSFSVSHPTWANNSDVYLVRINGVAQTLISGQPLGYTTVGSKFRIEKSNSTITFKVNNVIVKQFFSIPNSAMDFIGDASILSLFGNIYKPRMSFGCKQMNQYALLNKKLDGGYYIVERKKLLFKYDEEYEDVDKKLTFNIYNKKNTVVYSSLSMSSSPIVRIGDNRYSIDINNNSYIVSGQTMPSNEFYILEVINEKNEKWYLRFKK